MRLAPGTRLGNYEVVSGIGEGGMGEVYRAHDTVLNRDVALKLVHPDFCHHADSLRRLRREARALAVAQSSRTSPRCMNSPSSATAAASSWSWSAATRSRISLRHAGSPVDEALRLARRLPRALEAAHEQGIMHRDLKPANIKITTGRHRQGARLRPGQDGRRLTGKRHWYPRSRPRAAS